MFLALLNLTRPVALEMKLSGAQAIWETPYFIQGHTGFKNQAATIVVVQLVTIH